MLKPNTGRRLKKAKHVTTIMSGQQWVLGDLADKVEKVYGENRLKQFAEDINYRGNVCTLERCRDVCRAFPKTGADPGFSLRLNCSQHIPVAFEIVERNPDISKAEARELMRQWRAENPSTATAEQQAEDEDQTTRTMRPDQHRPHFHKGGKDQRAKEDGGRFMRTSGLGTANDGKARLSSSRTMPSSWLRSGRDARPNSVAICSRFSNLR